MLALSRHTAIGLASIAIIVSCGHSTRSHTEAEYLDMQLKLTQASGRRHEAMNAAALDHNPHTSIAMLNAVTDFMRKSREGRPSQEEMLKLPQKTIYEMELHDYNEINKILRSYGFGDIAIDFDPSK